MSRGGSGHRLVDHTGDMALSVWAPTLPALYDEAARALFAVIVDLDAIEAREELPLSIAGAVDREDLLVRFLAELLFHHDAHRWLFRGFRVRTLDAHAVAGEAIGERMDPARHAIARQVKAVTYHASELREQPAGWSAKIVLDL
jgi:SHS2 domain-containing protein